MVTTPWFDYEIPMTEAAELGTQKVMQEHCSIGLLVTTDGTVTDIPRADYIAAEKRSIADMKATGKPFLIVINSTAPNSEAALALRDQLASEYGLQVITADCQALDRNGICRLLHQLLYSFPLQQLNVHLPRWMDVLEPEHPVKAALYTALLRQAEASSSLADAENCLSKLKDLEQVVDFSLRSIDPGTGTVSCAFTFPESLFYEILSSKAGISIENDGQLLELLTELSAVKREYDKISDALTSAKATGYGIVMPAAEEMSLEPPELLRKNGTYGVKLRAGAPSIHMVRVDIDTQINPIVGDEKQSRDLVDYLAGESPERLWESNIFGKSVYAMIQEGITAKLLGTPTDVRDKIRGSLTRIVNEGANGLICLIL
jgi:stage IV sporulation protein A